MIKIREHIEIECEIEFDFEEGEPLSKWHPGCPDDAVDIKITPLGIAELEGSDEIREICVAWVEQDKAERAYDHAEMLIRGRQEWNVS